jgi:hypothetical protein
MKINDIPIQDEKHILILLQRLAAGAESCVILDRDESHFLQTDGKELMFKNPEGLYRSVRKDFSAAELQELFINYYREKSGCLSNYQWQLIPGFSDWESEAEEDDSEENNQRLLNRLKKVLKR